LNKGRVTCIDFQDFEDFARALMVNENGIRSTEIMIRKLKEESYESN